MDLDLLKTFTERLRAESIGDPEWIASKNVFEYPNQTIEVVTVLKLVRAAQGIHALSLLCRKGLFVDMGAVYRCVVDCTSEVYFLMEKYPEQSSTVQKFLRHFYSTTIDGYLSDGSLSSGVEPVPTKKIHNAMIRSITGREQAEPMKRIVTNIYRTYSGYTHAGYSHIMEMYGGSNPNLTFNISGIPSQKQIEKNWQNVIEAYKSVLYAIAHAARKFGRKDLYRDVKQCC